MTVEHTKGPWRAFEGRRGWQIHSSGPSHLSHWIANIKCESCPAHEEGNARLIAAAPELLECLKDARRLLTDQDAIDLEYVDSVIAKAEGTVSRAETAEEVA